MNFLAHLALAPQTPHGWVGSIAPDLIHGPLPDDLHPEVADAALEHQRIDRFTDRHAAFHRTRDRLEGLVESRLRGILTDVLYDHALARGWARLREDPLDGFIATAEQALADHPELMPAEMQTIVRRMMQEQWLASYASPVGLAERLAQMNRRINARLNRTMDLAITPQQIDRLYPAIAEDLDWLWPDLIAHVKDHRERAQSTRLAS